MYFMNPLEVSELLLKYLLHSSIFLLTGEIPKIALD
jgi:hypothetical protein